MSHHPLHHHLDTYLTVRDALGFHMRAARTLLRDFVHFVETQHTTGPIRAQYAVDWACAGPRRRGPGGAAQRLSMARGFLTYVRASMPDTEVPATGVVAAFRRPTPYLLTPQHIQALIQAAELSEGQRTRVPSPFATMIGLMASTGLRVGETLRLTIGDLHLEQTPPCLHIRETTFHKSRFVPVHPTTAVPLRHSLTRRCTLPATASSDPCFVLENGHALTHKVFGHRFATLCRQLNLWPTDGGRRPSPRALRHAFAIERIRRWYHEGADVQPLLPCLSVY